MYNLDYFYNMLRMYSTTAKQICDIRWKFVADAQANTVLDYGSGCGFFKAFAPHDVQVDTYDIIPVPQTGITKDHYDLITFWDVLEHVPDLTTLTDVIKRTNWVAITVPIKPPDVPWENYKHFKLGEHIHHFQEDSLKAVMRFFNFELYTSGNPECPPRDMVGSFLFKRIESIGKKQTPPANWSAQ